MKAALARFGQATLRHILMALFILRGIIILLFGGTALLWPNLTVQQLATFFAVFILLDGLVAFLLALVDLGQHLPWWGHLGEAMLGVVIGLVTLGRQSVTSQGLLYLILIWALLMGVLEALVNSWMQRRVRGSWLPFLSSWFSALFGLVLLVRPPAEGALGSVRVIVLYAFIQGTMQIVCGLCMRSMTTHPEVQPKR
jgi:uncharacterized membrane protein HdeD (DUF308 family)